MQEGYFYFLTDKYCNDNNKYYVMSNKETDSQGNPHKRPCYYAIEDLDNSNILWMIPISSKVEKYKKIKKDKINKNLDLLMVISGLFLFRICVLHHILI